MVSHQLTFSIASRIWAGQTDVKAAQSPPILALNHKHSQKTEKQVVWSLAQILLNHLFKNLSQIREPPDVKGCKSFVEGSPHKACLQQL